MTHGRVPCVYRMRRTWSSPSYNKNSSMGRRLRWNQTENSLKLSLALAYEYADGLAPAVFDSNAWYFSRHSPKFCFWRFLGRQRSYFYARAAAHRGRNGQLAQIHTLGGGWTSLVQGINQRGKVGLQLFYAKRGATNGGMNNASLVGTEIGR